MFLFSFPFLLFFKKKNEISEDCLFLNVYAPPTTNTSASDALLPVMVWIHGGRFEQGSGGVDLYGEDNNINSP